MKRIIFLLLSVFIIVDVYSQTRTIKGVVVCGEEDLEPLIGVDIIINDTVKIGVTDINGAFCVVAPNPVNSLLFQAFPFEDVNINVNEDVDYVDIIMMPYFIYDFVSNRKVDRDRMKRFKQLPKMHKQAYEKGIFKTEQPCYTREFVPRYTNKKKKAE